MFDDGPNGTEFECVISLCAVAAGLPIISRLESISRASNAAAKKEKERKKRRKKKWSLVAGA